MHPDILSPDQEAFLPLLGEFRSSFGLIGGTAIALHLGHRRSIDFDLMTYEPLNREDILQTLRTKQSITSVLISEDRELTVAIRGVKWTFLQYPFVVECSHEFDKIVRMPSLLSLATMKAYALSRRAKWKDYVDLYFVFQTEDFHAIIEQSRRVFGGEFNEKLFREQLGYFEDIDYSESVEYMPGHEKSDDSIKEFLQKISVTK